MDRYTIPAGAGALPISEMIEEHEMGIRGWFREKMAADGSQGGDNPPNQALLDTILARDKDRAGALGQYDSSSYPAELRALLNRRAEVARDLLRIDIIDPAARIAAIPRLREMLRKYPHPLVYETLIHAYVDDGRFDEAKGVAFAARQRRLECGRSEHPEVRGEIDFLHEWNVKDIEQLRKG